MTGDTTPPAAGEASTSKFFILNCWVFQKDCKTPLIQYVTAAIIYPSSLVVPYFQAGLLFGLRRRRRRMGHTDAGWHQGDRGSGAWSRKGTLALPTEEEPGAVNN